MRKLAILSTDDLEDFFVYDHLAYEPLKQAGWEVEEVSWHAKDVDWEQFEVVVIRSTWDYQSYCSEFVAVLEKINAGSAKLENSLNLVKWNISKNYLLELEQKGIDIVPTLWCQSFDYPQIKSAFAHFNCAEIVIKPWVSANADHTFRLTPQDVEEQLEGLEQVFGEREYMLQPFLRNVVREGEYSLFYFAGEYSHSILKIPKRNDFRVQEEHGGQMRSIEASEELLAAGQAIMLALPEQPLYARIDLVAFQGRYVLMEAELIEPSLYFNMDDESANRFANAFINRYGKG
ncbi:hypothetical protein [Aliiglaciecola sp. LCG003]|uniref:ATP-grasp domain-containing protein n=1 Tax=Aliiglaciecola sp. LCG003 TaxID=3053655 RepID=UPI00257341B4|nr:hypothetical protein [Aliiglaciecola sp. LCG003]WJG09625.1 hypothetical protein QR722_00890 [Aliiglaciecola sp. LCG003]